MGIYIVIGFIGCFISLAMASTKHRSAGGWAVLGFLFPLISIIALACLPALPAPESAS